MSYSVPASRNGLPLHIAGRTPAYKPGVIATRQTAPPVIAGSGSLAYGKPVLTHNLIKANANTPANKAAVAPHSPISGVSSIKSPVVVQRRGVAPGGNQPGRTTTR
jgi:hypothetical protein